MLNSSFGNSYFYTFLLKFFKHFQNFNYYFLFLVVLIYLSKAKVYKFLNFKIQIFNIKKNLQLSLELLLKNIINSLKIKEIMLNCLFLNLTEFKMQINKNIFKLIKLFHLCYSNVTVATQEKQTITTRYSQQKQQGCCYSELHFSGK